ncbi:hypothetical protein ACFVJM_38290 [Streptomyces virginiae]|uniref:hypothetical protein n=1 Tax=Streptomyces virginiae TaxID=1961 RepID=UPI003635D818
MVSWKWKEREEVPPQHPAARRVQPRPRRALRAHPPVARRRRTPGCAPRRRSPASDISAGVRGGQIPDDVADTIERLRVQLAALADSRPLAAVEAAARVEKLGTARLQHAVTSAVRNGASWTAISSATGTTRQAAHQRFSKVPF